MTEQWSNMMTQCWNTKLEEVSVCEWKSKPHINHIKPAAIKSSEQHQLQTKVPLAHPNIDNIS